MGKAARNREIMRIAEMATVGEPKHSTRSLARRMRRDENARRRRATVKSKR